MKNNNFEVASMEYQNNFWDGTSDTQLLFLIFKKRNNKFLFEKSLILDIENFELLKKEAKKITKKRGLEKVSIGVNHMHQCFKKEKEIINISLEKFQEIAKKAKKEAWKNPSRIKREWLGCQPILFFY